MTALAVLQEHKEDTTMMTVAPLKDIAMVVTPGSGGQRCGGQWGTSGGTWLVLQLVDGVSDAGPWFEESADMVVTQTLVTLDDCRARVE